jgi:hypothetical protein
MSNSNRSTRETPRSTKSLWVLFTAFVLAAGLLFTGCPGTTETDPQPDPPAKPVITSVVPASATSLTVNWAAATGALHYEVYYAETGSTIPATAAKSNISTESTTLTSLTSATVYNVWVKAVNSSGSTASDPWEAVPYDPGLMNDFVGIWDSYSDGYVISATSIEYDDGFPDWPGDFAGNIRYVDEYDAVNGEGVIIVEYTEMPGSPYTEGTSNYEGVYYQKKTSGIKLANAYAGDPSTNIQSLTEAITFFSDDNESALVYDWESVYVQYKQSGTVFDMGVLRGVWEGDDDLTDILGNDSATWLKISDYRLTVYLGPISPISPVYSGTIVDRTDTTANSGFVYIQFTQGQDAGMTEIVWEVDDFYEYYYVIRWEKDGGKYNFSVYNDHNDVVGNNLDSLKNYTKNPYFLDVDDTDYEGYGGMIAYMGGDEYVYVGFTKQ